MVATWTSRLRTETDARRWQALQVHLLHGEPEETGLRRDVQDSSAASPVPADSLCVIRIVIGLSGTDSCVTWFEARVGPAWVERTPSHREYRLLPSNSSAVLKRRRSTEMASFHF